MNTCKDCEHYICDLSVNKAGVMIGMKIACLYGPRGALGSGRPLEPNTEACALFRQRWTPLGSNSGRWEPRSFEEVKQ